MFLNIIVNYSTEMPTSFRNIYGYLYRLYSMTKLHNTICATKLENMNIFIPSILSVLST